MLRASRAKCLMVTAMLAAACPAIAPLTAADFIRGDAGADGMLDIGDAIKIFRAIFSRDRLDCSDAGDVNDDGQLSIVDPIVLFYRIIQGSTAYPEPFPDCGCDPTEDDLTCDSFAFCIDEGPLGSVLSGGQQIPIVLTDGGGRATFDINEAGTEIDFFLETEGLTGILAAHLHAAGLGETGPVIFVLSEGRFTDSVQGTLTAADLLPREEAGITVFAAAVDAILSGKTYINVRTELNPDGEVRGQLGPQEAAGVLRGDQEIEPVDSGGSGSATLRLNRGQTKLEVRLDVSGLTGITEARLHFGRLGSNGPVLFSLPVATPSGSGCVTLTADDLQPREASNILTFEDAVDALLSGNTYINYRTESHSAVFFRDTDAKVTHFAHFLPEVHGNFALHRIELVGDWQYFLHGEFARNFLDHFAFVCHIDDVVR